MTATCATPPHLEGATLQEIPLDSLNCDGNVNRNSNRNVLQQLEMRSRETNLTFENKFSDDVSQTNQKPSNYARKGAKQNNLLHH